MDRSSPTTFLTVAATGAFLVPLALGILFASPEPYWLDSPEFTAAAQTLGIPHPPGHPLYVMLVKPFTLLPLGSIALRVSLASAVFGAIASALLFHICLALLERTAVTVHPAVRGSIALAASLLVSVTPGWWFQCVRAEVYSLQIMIVMATLYALLRYCLDGTNARVGLLYGAGFLFGLGATNHHFIMAALVPAVIPPLLTLTRNKGAHQAIRTGLKMGATGICGLLPYAFLPLRSGTGAAITLGGVHSLSDFWWVVSAKVYQKSMAAEHIDPLSDRTGNALFSMMGELGPVVVVASLAGLYVLLRYKPLRPATAAILIAGGVTILLRSVMGFDPFNPDYYGYMMPAMGVLAILAAVFAGVALDVLQRAFVNGRYVVPILAASLMALPLSKASESATRVNLSDFRATRLFYDLSLETAAPGTMVIVSYYKLFFILWSAPHIDGSRPDIAVINPQLFGYPGYLESTLKARPDLRPLAWSMVVNGKITEAAITDLALKMPLRVEPSPWIQEQAADHLLPDGITYIATPESMSPTDLAAASGAHFARWRNFYHLLGSGSQEHETWRILSWSHYLDAMHLAGHGDLGGAREAVKMARALGSTTPQIAGLEKALGSQNRGSIDVTPFLIERPSESRSHDDSGDNTADDSEN